ncbi:hypothetical protein L3Q82_000694 [Scortum barcoo]|uniref:Uncharacterized protein n=1 Tax=Scortum barcoo TaxID=214431 RepID=A0ACB8WDB1_9TELE|nr:hypothetical protein L3Q82_000694 [Scortum barcoo]
MAALSHGGSSSNNNHTREPEPMHIGRTRLSPEERASARQGNLCLFLLWTSRPLHLPMPSKRDRLTSRGGGEVMWLTHFGHLYRLSGADVSLIDEELALQLGITPDSLSKAISASALDGHLLGTVTHQTESPFTCCYLATTMRQYSFTSCIPLVYPLILGYPWLRRHNPHVNWLTGAILGWGSSCHQVCLRQAVVPQPSRCFSTPPDLTGVPTEYLDFREVFNKTKATSLPPHRPYDCAIETSSPAPHLPEAACTPCRLLKERPWRPTSMTLWQLASSGPHHHQQGQDFSLWRRKIRLFVPA